MPFRLSHSLVAHGVASVAAGAASTNLPWAAWPLRFAVLAVCAAVAAGAGWRLARRMTGPIQAAQTQPAGEGVAAPPAFDPLDGVGLAATPGAVTGAKGAVPQDALAGALAERDAARARAQALTAEMDTFAYVASHDLRAPLRVIRNAASWLEEDLAPHLDADTRESMDMLRGRVARMDRLLEDLLLYSRVGRIPEPATPVSGRRLAAMLREARPLPDGFTLHVGPGFDGITVPDRPLLPILSRLLDNAVRHHDRDCGAIRIDVTTDASTHQFVVEDDGPGIAPEHRARVFEVFQTLKPRDVVDTSGIGLSVVRKYADLAGGAITLQSDGARGCRFCLTWPRNPAAPQVEAAAFA